MREVSLYNNISRFAGIARERDTKPRADLEVFPKSQIVIATDLEGPHLTGDTAMEVMNRLVKPLDARKANGIDYGSIIYNETYNWFREVYEKEKLYQEGADIAFALAPLLARGVTDVDLKNIARESKRTPGSETLIKELQKKGAIVVGVTTAWELPHSEIVREIVGIDGLVGTHLFLDKIRNYFNKAENQKQFTEEMEVTNNFLNDSFNIIDEMQGKPEEVKSEVTRKLRKRISGFYHDELGITYDQNEREQRQKKWVTHKTHEGEITKQIPVYKTRLGKIIEAIDVIGDKRKSTAAARIFNQYGAEGALCIAIGDGYNDRVMLANAPISIGVNGEKAAKAAKIGVITDDMSVLAVLIDIIKNNRDLPLDGQIKLAQEVLGERAIIHPGGENIPQPLIDQHKKMRVVIRGKAVLVE